ncbi:antitoxin [Yanshouia hominis]|uniref:Antitoxin n=1 Tax=Yanshouia hominis TaxID=2763673 RepID=A0ABR7NLF4_9FIRM|nr:antitoxin [Yanshouia hominis]MBC8576672.1 antitoxin [Yanshouia hominis]
MSRNSNESILKYQKKAYEDIRLRVKRGEKDIIKAHAESKGMSLNAYINDLIEKDMKENEK